MTTAKKITITLSNRKPVNVNPDEWPVVAKAIGDSYTGNDVARYEQARCNGELDRYRLIVREHADGRVLVYGKFDASGRSSRHSTAGGRMLAKKASEEALMRTIREVGEELELPEYIIRDCFASFKPEEI